MHVGECTLDWQSMGAHTAIHPRRVRMQWQADIPVERYGQYPSRNAWACRCRASSLSGLVENHRVSKAKGPINCKVFDEWNDRSKGLVSQLFK